jgi:hypothetical protein
MGTAGGNHRHRAGPQGVWDVSDNVVDAIEIYGLEKIMVNASGDRDLRIRLPCMTKFLKCENEVIENRVSKPFFITTPAIFSARIRNSVKNPPSKKIWHGNAEKL